MHPRARAPQQEKPLQWEAHAPQLEKIWTVTKTQCSQKQIKKKLIKNKIQLKIFFFFFFFWPGTLIA